MTDREQLNKGLIATLIDLDSVITEYGAHDDQVDSLLDKLDKDYEFCDNIVGVTEGTNNLYSYVTDKWKRG